MPKPTSPSETPLLHMYHSYDHHPPLNSAPLVTISPPSTLQYGTHYFGHDMVKKPGLWRRMLMAVRKPNVTSRNSGMTIMSVDGKEEKCIIRPRSGKLHTAWTCLLGVGLIVFLIGAVHIANSILGYVPLFKDDTHAPSGQYSYNPEDPSQLLDITHNVIPVACHSHNDYWRRIPLYDALRWGCTGVEADVWLFDNDLFVGHSTHALTKDRTFRSMYVDRLVQMLNYRNAANTSDKKVGVFETVPTQSLVLLVDFKNNGAQIFPVVSQQLSTLREQGYLTYFDGQKTIKGPITVVATGNAPFDLITANSTYRDIFFDAPLDRMYEVPSSLRGISQEQLTSTSTPIATTGQGTVGTSPISHFDATNSYYTSVNFRHSIGYPWFGRISSHQIQLIRGQIQGAHNRGLKVRYWGTPQWPVGLRNKIWNVLVEEGVDYLNGDDLEAMTRLDWGR